MRGRWLLLGVVALAVGALAAGCGGDDSAPQSADSAAVPFDQAFIDAMVPHHESALAMAREAKAAGLAEPELVEIADAILQTQQQEIEQMTAWRGDWFGSSEIDPAGADALGLSPDAMGMTHMSGSFDDASDVDAMFASEMVGHHTGAIAMAELALQRSERDEIRQLAQAIIDAQSIEIQLMKPHAAGEHSMQMG